LLAEDQGLRVLGDGVHVLDVQEFDGATDQKVEEAECRIVLGTPSRACLVKLRIGLLEPSGYLWERGRVITHPVHPEKPDNARGHVLDTNPSLPLGSIQDARARGLLQIGQASSEIRESPRSIRISRPGSLDGPHRHTVRRLELRHRIAGQVQNP